MTRTKPLWGIVPAAGRSSRMGSPKALLDADGPTFMDRVVQCLLEGGCDEVVVAVREDPGPVAAAARQAGARTVVNPEPDHPEWGGPVSSVRVALDTFPADVRGAVLLPVDHPRVAPDTVRTLLRAHREGVHPATLPVFAGRRGHPVVLDRTLFEEVREEALAEGVRTVLGRHQAELLEVQVPDRGILLDVDTLPDYRRAFPRSYRKRFHSR